MDINSYPLLVPDRGFVSKRPASHWEEGLICGNGTLGLNAFCRPLDERIIFSHEELFMPMGAPVVPPDQSEHLPAIRNLISSGNYQAACQLQSNHSGQKGFMYPDFFVPAFDMTIRSTARGEIREYQRSVNFQSGEAIVHWMDDRGCFERRMFVSRKDGVAVILLTGSGNGSLECQIKLEPREPSDEFNDDTDIAKTSAEMFKEHIGDIESRSDDSSLSLHYRFLNAYPGSIQSLEGFSRVVSFGGLCHAERDGSLTISGTDRVLILLDISLIRDARKSGFDSMRKSLTSLPADYDLLLHGHRELHGELFNRMRLDLGGGKEHLRTTEELIEISTFDMINLALLEKEFDAGRHNIISATGNLPPNLQGLWGGTYVPGWASDYTHNGNLPSAIASNLQGNLPELMLAYTSYLESLLPNMEWNAKKLYGARGIQLPSRTSTHGYNNAYNGDFAGGMWISGAGWAARYFYDYYLFTGDRTFLADHAFPFMENAALFFEDFLFEGSDGTFIFSPTQSPENTPGNSDSQASFNATIDIAVAKELLHFAIAASRELGIKEEKILIWEMMLSKMPEYLIDDSGVIKEWLTPDLTNSDDHRHSSHLYPLYFGLPDEISTSHDLRSAFCRCVENKLATHWKMNDRGYMSFGLVQLGQAAASLGEGELAYHCLKHLANRFWLSNLASMHNQRSLFNMDISGGMPAVIIQMLVASEPGKIRLLPALPDAWPQGTIEGVLCRGAIEIHRLQWQADRVEVELTSQQGQELILCLPSPIHMAEIIGETAHFSPASTPSERKLKLSADQKTALRITLNLN